MITVRDVVVFATGACLASLQVSACGEEKARPPLAEQAVGNETADIPPDRLSNMTDAFTSRTCSAPISGFVDQCGIVTVPETAGSEETLELAVVRVFAKSKTPKADPLIYLEGGPGGAVTGHVDLIFPYFEALAEDRDVIFFDQRGTGRSKPSLGCDGAEDLTECHARVSELIDPSVVSSSESARDVDAIRRAFGYEKLNLLGISYGTRLALTVLRDFPGAVRSAIIDAVVPLQVDLIGQLTPNGSRAFEVLFDACHADPTCKEKYPDPMGQLLAVAKTLDEDPHDASGYQVDGATFVSILFNLMYSPAALTMVPFLIDQAAEGSFELLEELAFNLSRSDFSFGMHLSVQCAEELPFTSPDAVAAAAEEFPAVFHQGFGGGEYFTYCADWPVPAAPARENQAVTSSVPTLALAGRFDPVTPLAYSELAAESLSHSYVFLFSSESHGSSISDCGLEVAQSFLDDPSSEPSTTCLSALPEPEFEALRRARGAAPTPATARLRRVGRSPQFSLQAPTAEDVETARRDLELRLRL